jgi:phosphoribosylformylglycinamidine synthase
MNPRYGDYDTYHMATSAIDEAMRNCVAVGGDPSRVAILDNFCWGDCEKSETLGSLVRAALACHDLSLVLETPFISGKDSLNNEFSYVDSQGEKQTIAIPPSLLISAMGQVDDVSRCVTMDLKQAGNTLYLVGATHEELGGSHFCQVHGLTGGQVPVVDPQRAKQTFAAMHQAIHQGTVRSCHDLSEGGLAAAVAEMAFAGEIGAQIDLSQLPADAQVSLPGRLFSESNTRFLCEVEPDQAAAFAACFQEANIPHAALGKTTVAQRLVIRATTAGPAVLEESLERLKAVWKDPLDF